MRLPPDWTAERASGWWELHHLTHTPCGFRTHNAYDLIIEGPFGPSAVREVVYGHRCEGDDE
jgi:hypothetical protein